MKNSLLKFAVMFVAGSVFAQEVASLTPLVAKPPVKKASDLIKKQAPPVVNKDLATQITPDNSYVIISLAQQRVWMMFGTELVYIDSPISSGKRAGMTPTGKFTITEKDKDHRSSIYGDFVDKRGRTVRRGISRKVDSAPGGTRYVGAPMKFFCRLTGDGVGMHIGKLPGYPASHGCIRLPEEIAPLIYEKVKLGSPVEIRAE